MWVSTLQYICLCQQAFSNSEDQTHKVTIQETKLAHTDQSTVSTGRGNQQKCFSREIFLSRFGKTTVEKGRKRIMGNRELCKRGV